MATPAAAAPVVQLFVNPRASRSARCRIAGLRRALDAAGASVIVAPSATAPLAIDPRADHVCAVGGDGTVRHVVAALHRSGRRVPISVFPVGTVNLLAREREYPRDPRAFVARMLAGAPAVRQYSALAGDAPLVTCVSVGPDSRAVAAVSPRLKRWLGRAAYLVAFAGVLRRWPRPALTLTCGEARIACEAVYVAKGRLFAGPWSFAPQAALTEPLLHVVALRDVTRRRYARLVWAMMRGWAVDGIEGVSCFACTALTIEAATPEPAQVDGDIEGHLPLAIRLRDEPIDFA